MNKGFLQSIVVIIALLILAPIFLVLINSISCISEKKQIDDLNSTLIKCNNNLTNYDVNLNKCLSGKNEINEKLKICETNLYNCIDDLNKCNSLVSKLINKNERLKKELDDLKKTTPNQIMSPAIVSSFIPILLLIIILFSISPKIHIFKLDIKKTISYIFEHCLFPYFYKSNLINKIFTFINIVLIIIIIFCIQIILLLKSAGLLRLF